MESNPHLTLIFSTHNLTHQRLKLFDLLQCLSLDFKTIPHEDFYFQNIFHLLIFCLFL